MVMLQPLGGAPAVSAWKSTVSAAPATVAPNTTPALRALLRIMMVHRLRDALGSGLHRRLRVEHPFQRLRQITGFPPPPVVQEDVAGLLMGHMLMDGDDVDAFLAHRPQHRLQLVLGHREI